MAIIGLFGIGMFLNTIVLPTPGSDTELSNDPDIVRLQQIAQSIQSGGPPPDGIPPIELPQYWPATEADEFLLDNDIIFGFIQNGQAKAFPQRILVWHEIVNDIGNVSITYCPLTGSAIGFLGKVGNTQTTFGTSGRLVNSNLVMYDRASNSYFPQILGRGVTGDHLGTRLEKVQLLWTQWEKWKAEYPDTLVLSSATGNIRNYDFDPYGNYKLTNTYY